MNEKSAIKMCINADSQSYKVSITAKECVQKVCVKYAFHREKNLEKMSLVRTLQTMRTFEKVCMSLLPDASLMINLLS